MPESPVRRLLEKLGTAQQIHNQRIDIFPWPALPKISFVGSVYWSLLI
jgi:hypothetical protein